LLSVQLYTYVSCCYCYNMSTKKSNVVYLKDHLGTWIEAIRCDDPVAGTVLTLHVNHTTNEVDVIQTTNDGETVKTRLNPVVGVLLYECLRKFFGFTGDPKPRKV